MPQWKDVVFSTYNGNIFMMFLYFMYTYILKPVRSIVSFAWTTFIVTPFAHLYLSGPSINGYGFWHGLQSEEICARLTNVPASHWIQHEDQCMQLVQTHFQAFLVAVQVIIYGYMIWTTFHMLCHYYFITKPMLKAAFTLRDQRQDDFCKNKKHE